VTTRTYGSYEYRPPEFADPRSRGQWVLDLEPAVRQRARRIFGRLAPSRTTKLVMADSIEVARDIAWLMERFPLEAVDPRSQRWLSQGAEQHALHEQIVADVLAGTYERGVLPRTPAKEPREYQLQAIDVLRTKGRLLLTDEVGLGKTLTALLGLVHDDALPAVVVPPTHLPPRWVTELQEAFPWLTHEVARSTKPSLRARTGQLADVTIVSYSKLPGWAESLANQVQTVIFDEVQELRNGDETAKGAAAGMISDNASYVLGLSATPIHNYGDEVWNLFNVMAPGQLGTKEEFMREWGGSGRTVKRPEVLGNYLREQGLMLGRTRVEVGRELPQTIKVPRLVDSDTAALEAIKGDIQELARRILADTSTHTEKFTAGGQLDMKLRHATGVDKAPYVAEFVRLLMESEDKIVLWGWHRDVYEIWLRELAEFGPLLYTGSESPKQKRAAELAFCTPRTPAPTTEVLIDADGLDVDGNPAPAPDCRILIMSLRSGAGVDGLQKFARVGVFGELDWSPAVHEQAIGRLRRDGMEADPVVAYFLNSAEGSDPPMLEKLQIKRQQAEPLISKDGKLFESATVDPHRARSLAESVLGITPTDPEAAPAAPETEYLAPVTPIRNREGNRA
jgi:hypothetical protein